MNFRPCIDIHNGQVKQIVGGSLIDMGDYAKENFVSDKDGGYYATLYKNAGLKGGHIILLNPKDSRYYEDDVLVTSYVFKNGEILFDNLERIKRETGKEHLVLDLSCRKKDGDYYIVTDRWQKFTNVKITGKLMKELSSYCDEYLIHAVDVEGQAHGIESGLVRILDEYNTIPVTYAGGVGSYEDLTLLKELGHNKIDVTIGSALDLFGGKLEFKKVLDICRS